MRAIGENLERQQRLTRPKSQSPIARFAAAASKKSSPQSGNAGVGTTGFLARIRRINLCVLLVITFVIAVVLPICFIYSAHTHHSSLSLPSLANFIRSSTSFGLLGGGGGGGRGGGGGGSYNDDDGDDDDVSVVAGDNDDDGDGVVFMDDGDSAKKGAFTLIPATDHAAFEEDAITVIIPLRRALPTESFFQALLQFQHNHHYGHHHHHHHEHRLHNNHSSSTMVIDTEFVFVANNPNHTTEVVLSRIDSARKKLLATTMTKKTTLPPQEEGDVDNNSMVLLNEGNSMMMDHHRVRVVRLRSQKHQQQQQQQSDQTTTGDSSKKFPALGHFLFKGAKAARPKSKYLLFLSSFAQVLDPQQFLENLLRDIKRKNSNNNDDHDGGAPCSPTDLLVDRRRRRSTADVDDNDDDDENNDGNDKNSEPTTTTTAATQTQKQKASCRYGAIQCLILEPSTSVDALRSSPHLVADAGWTIDIGTSSNSPTKFLDETVFLANREAGTPETATRFQRGSPPHTVDGINPTCMFVSRADFENAAAFERQTFVPTNIDAVLSKEAFPAMQRRESTLSDVFESIVVVERIVERMTMDEVRRATPRLRRQVRTSYGAVTDAVALFESLANRGIASERAKLSRPKFPGLGGGGGGDQNKLGVKHKNKKRSGDGAAFAQQQQRQEDSAVADEVDECLLKQGTEAQLVCATDRLIRAGDVARNMANYVVPTIPENVLGWMLALRMRFNNNNNNNNDDNDSRRKRDEDHQQQQQQQQLVRVGVSTSARVSLDFSSIITAEPRQQERDDAAAAVEAIKIKNSASSAMAASVPDLVPWLSVLRSIHHAYKDVLVVQQQQKRHRRHHRHHRHQQHPQILSNSDRNTSTSRQGKKQVGPLVHHVNHKRRRKIANIDPPRVDLSKRQVLLRVVWFAICCGCCGFSAEMAHYARPLSELYPVSLIPGPTCFCPGLPNGFSDMIARQNIKINQYSREELSPGEVLIWISHTDPPSFVQGGFFVRRKPTYLIGRTMYEFSRLPVQWEDHVTEADELWVPSMYVRDIYLRCGKGLDPERVLVVPEGIDTNFFNPNAHSPLRFVKDADVDEQQMRWRNVFCNRDSFWSGGSQNHHYFSSFPQRASSGGDDDGADGKDYVEEVLARHRHRNWSRPGEQFQHNINNTFYQNRAKTPPEPFEFFSNFKWEPRKGWEFLFEAYFKAFYETQATQDVTLVVLSYVYYAHGTPTNWTVFNETFMMEELTEAMARRFPGRKMHEQPRFCIVAESVTEFELAQLFRGADAFVLPTRGEGWGLPTMQAMSMGLPVISTNWGGSVDFTTPDTTFLVELDSVDEIDKESMYTHREGKKWATPSVAHLTQLLRYVFTEREHAAEVGERAREHIVRNYDDYVVVDILSKRLQQIREILR